MKFLFDIGHPAHVHLFRNFISYLKKKNQEICVVSRDKDITNILLDHYGIPYICLSSARKGVLSMFAELIYRNYQIIKLHNREKFDAAFGTSVSIAHLSAIKGIPSFNLNEDDDDVVPLYSLLTYPFAPSILHPQCIRYKRWQKRRVFYPSYHELAYLHPNNFTPDPNVLGKYNLQEKKYVVVRFSSLNAHHDIGKKGISSRLWRKIESFCSDYTIVFSIEGEISHQIQPWDMHHVLAFSKMIISDSQTMTVESAVLGIPSIRINSFYDRCSVLDELEKTYELTFAFHPEKEQEILNKTSAILSDENSSYIWNGKRKKLLKKKVDFNEWLIAFSKRQLLAHT